MKDFVLSSLLSLGALALMASPAQAGAFEGTIDMKMTTAHGNGTVRFMIGKGGMRNEMDMQTPQMPIHLVTLVKASNRDITYMIHDQDKSYNEMDRKKIHEMTKGRSETKYTVKNMGKEKVGGYDAVHAHVTTDRGDEFDVWTNKDLVDFDELAKAMGPNGPGEEGLMKALKEAGAGGFWVKMVHKRPGKADEDMTMELVKVEKKSLPASTWEIPAGYTKKEGMGMGPMGGSLPPEQQQKLRDAMKNMTPEQQEMMKKAMQKHGQP